MSGHSGPPQSGPARIGIPPPIMAPQSQSTAEPWVWYPLVLAAYPALAIYAANVQEVLPSEALAPIAASVAFSAALWCLLAALIRSPFRRGAVHLAILAAVFGYGLYSPVLQWFWSTERGSSIYVLAPLALVAVEIAFYAAYRWLSAGQRARTVTLFLNRFALAAVLLAGGTAAWRYAAEQIDQRRIDAAQESSAIGLNAAGSISLPDVYVLMLDAYGGAGVLKDFYSFDNEPFLQALEQRGFYVARNSYSNYPSTKLSLPASLNMDYLQVLLGPDTRKWKVSGNLVRRSRVAREFRARGYSHVTFATGHAFTETPTSDVYLRPKRTLSDFDAYFLETTLVAPLFGLWQANSGESPSLRSHRIRINYILDELKHLPRGDKPKFVYAHIMCPHMPLAFNADGSPRTVDWHVDLATEGFRQGYVGQIQFLNPKVLDVVDAIQAHSPDAVIVVQGDHGPRLLDTRSKKVPWADYAREHLETLNTFYFPGEKEYKDLHPAISQVNTFRIIFNRYFGTALEILPDISYLYLQQNYGRYVFTPVRWTEHGPQPIEPIAASPREQQTSR